MRFLLHWPIRLKLALGVGSVLLCLILVAATAIAAMVALRDAQRHIQEIQLANVIDYMRLEAGIGRNRVLLNRLLRSRDPARRAALVGEIRKISRENDAIVAPLAERVRRDPLPQDKFLALKEARDEFNIVRDTLILPDALAGRQEEAEAAFERSLDSYNLLSARAAELAKLAQADARLEVERSIALVQQAVLVIAVVGLLAVLAGVIVVSALQRVVARPIASIAATATRIGEGELDVAAPGADRRDEIGELARAFNVMTDSLRGLARIADKIAEGDLRATVKPRGRRDRLAISFDIMRENLVGLASEMRDGAAEAEGVAAAILDATQPLLVGMADQDTARRLQQSLLRLEEIGRRLGSVAGRLRLPSGGAA